MKRTDLPIKNLSNYKGKWVVLNPKGSRILAVGDTLKEISPLVLKNVGASKNSVASPSAFKVPRKDEGQYVL